RRTFLSYDNSPLAGRNAMADMATATHTATHKVVNLAGVHWMLRGRRVTFQSARPGFGVQVIATGEFLSRDGASPSAWRTKSAASVIAQYPPDFQTVKSV